jgi:Tfp pilus assembly protein PilF
LEELLQSDPDDTFLQYALAMAYISEGNAAAGLEQLDRVLAHDPRYVAAYFQKGQLLVKEGDAAAAREALVQGIEAARQVGDTHAAAEMAGFLETLGDVTA